MEKPQSSCALRLYGGVGGIRTLVPWRANAFRVRPVMTASIRLHGLYNLTYFNEKRPDWQVKFVWRRVGSGCDLRFNMVNYLHQ